ncbi:30S ribosomal protein S11, chloroplastic [Datura stramonium]|uniref:30S ribosomal protein S11, chloroplastic n=1 Tax=Datura stramonium TaxID=4076 RepID=A0ABS8RL53_DATST|nr:30S ribosomal protein S11, chloroplastic [Datura stramonium]
MAKAISKISSRRNGCIGSRKGARRIPKGVIHVQASFNNFIVIVTNVRGRVVSWSSAVVDQGLQRAEVMIKGPGLGRDAALRAIHRSGILLTFIRDAVAELKSFELGMSLKRSRNSYRLLIEK